MHSLALAIGAKDSKTIRGPGGQQKVIDILRELVRVTGRLLVLDRDVTTTPHVKCLLAAIAPDHDVLHVRCTTPGQRNAFRYAFDCQEEKVAGRGKPLALARFELDLRACIASFEAETVGTLRAKVMRHLRRVKIGIACASMSPRTKAAIRGALFDPETGARRPDGTVLETLEIPWPSFDADGAPVEGSEVPTRFPWEALPAVDKAALRLEEPRRLWVVLASRQFFETDLRPIVEKLGLTPDATYGFYNADAPATEALKVTPQTLTLTLTLTQTLTLTPWPGHERGVAPLPRHLRHRARHGGHQPHPRFPVALALRHE